MSNPALSEELPWQAGHDVLPWSHPTISNIARDPKLEC